MTADPAKAVADLVRAVREGQAALLMALDGMPVEQVGPAGSAELEAIAGEYAGPLRQAQALAAELDGGAPRRFSVRAADRRIVFAFVPGELVLGVQAGVAGLPGQMRHAIAWAASRLGDL